MRCLSFLLSIASLIFFAGWPTQAAAQCAAERLDLSAPSPGSNQQYGKAVDVHRDLMVVGSESDPLNGPNSGAAFVYRRTVPGGPWILECELRPQSPYLGYAGQFFGNAVAVFEDWIAVGARGDNTNGILSGAVYLFEYQSGSSPNVWVQRQKLTGITPSDQFGHAVDIYENKLIVGAPIANGQHVNDAGNAYIYERGSGGWTGGAIPDPQGKAGDSYGFDVAIHDNHVIVGAPQVDLSGISGTNHGQALIFRRQLGAWGLEARLESSNPINRANFGQSVSIHQDISIAGAPNDGTFGSAQGSAEIFEYPAAGWRSLQGTIYSPTPTTSGVFGSGVSINPNHAVMGAPGEMSTGTVHQFSKNGTGQYQHRNSREPINKGGVLALGSSTAISGKLFMAGSPSNSSPTGRAFLFQIEDRLTLFGPDPGEAGVPATLASICGTPGAQVFLAYSLKPGTGSVQNCPVQMRDPVCLGPLTANGEGRTDFSVKVPAKASGRTVYLQAVETSPCAGSNLVTYTFP